MEHGALQLFRRFGRVLFGRHLLATNATISTIMGIAGDLVQQHYEVLSGHQSHVNTLRTSHMAAAGLTTGMVSHYCLFQSLGSRLRQVLMSTNGYRSELFFGFCLASLASSDFYFLKRHWNSICGSMCIIWGLDVPAIMTEFVRGWPLQYQPGATYVTCCAAIAFTRYVLLDRWMLGRSLRVVVLKVLYDQVVFSPINLAVYFGTVGLLEQSGWAELGRELWCKGSTIYQVEWLVWPPAQFVNFYVLPLKYRVFFDNLVSFGFDVYSPYIKYKDQRAHVKST